jgi:hypothetical protein
MGHFTKPNIAKAPLGSCERLMLPVVLSTTLPISPSSAVFFHVRGNGHAICLHHF